MRRPCADREEKRVTHGRDMCGRSIAIRYVTKASSMSTGRKPEGDRAMTNALCPSRRILPVRRATRPRHPATSGIGCGAMPESLSDSPTAQALEALVDLDLDALADIDLPRGYGRD